MAKANNSHEKPMYAHKSSIFSVLRICLACLTLFTVVGCDTAPEKQPGANRALVKGELPVIGVLLFNEQDPYINILSKALHTSLAGKATLVVKGAQSNQRLQNKQVEMLIEEGVHALLVNIVEVQAAGILLDKARNAKLPIIFFNREPNLAVLAPYPLAAFVGTKIEEAGKMQGEIIAKLWQAHPEFDKNNDGKLQFIMLQGNADNPEALGRTEYSVKRAIELGVPMQQVGGINIANWDKELAEEATTLAMKAEPDSIELVVANNDAMALGALEALAEHGINAGGGKLPFIPVVGVDALPEALQAIAQGRMSGTILQDANSMAQAVTALVLNAVAGKPFLEGTPYAWDSNKNAVRIPYKSYMGESVTSAP